MSLSYGLTVCWAGGGSRVLSGSPPGSAGLGVSAGVEDKFWVRAQCLRVRWPPVPVVVM